MQERTIDIPLPTEVWIQIIRELPFHYQKSYLSISKFFHDISVPYVFASINIRLGSMRELYIVDEDRWCNWNPGENAGADAAMGQSYELLLHLTRSPAAAGLARAVKYVSVRAYWFSEESLPAGPLDMLEEALSVLRLREFAWYGCHPMPPSKVLEKLSTGSRDTLENIVLPAELLDHTPVLAFTRLKSLSFLNRSRYGNGYQLLDTGNSCCLRMGKTIMATSSSLRSLSIFGEALGKCNVQGLSALTELTLAIISDVGLIGTILTGCSRLQSLTILVGSTHNGDLAAVLRTYLSMLPRLTALRLYFSTWMREEGAMEAVAAFLCTRPLLERFELGHRWGACLLDDAEPVLESLCQLPRLRVLGLELSGGSERELQVALRPSHLQRFARCIPPQVTALSLWVHGRFGPSIATEADWTQFFYGLSPSCRFIHMSSGHGYPVSDELQRALFAHPPPSAELVGFNRDIRWVQREWGTGRWVGYSESWPIWRVCNRRVEDFGCEEWEWLLRPIDMKMF